MWGMNLGAVARRDGKGQHVGEIPKFWDLKTVLVGRSLKAGENGEESELEGWQGIMVCILFGSFKLSKNR